jgi:hypothetical protein
MKRLFLFHVLVWFLPGCSLLSSSPCPPPLQLHNILYLHPRRIVQFRATLLEGYVQDQDLPSFRLRLSQTTSCSWIHSLANACLRLRYDGRAWISRISPIVSCFPARMLDLQCVLWPRLPSLNEWHVARSKRMNDTSFQGASSPAFAIRERFPCRTLSS